MPHTPPWRSQIAFALIAFATTTGVTVAPAEAAEAPAHTITLKSSTTSASPGTNVRFTGSVTGLSAAGQTIALKRQQGSGPWKTYRTSKVSVLGTYSFPVVAALGAFNYRTVLSTSNSPSLTVTGLYGRDLAVVEAGQPFTLGGQLPTEFARTVHVQALVNGAWRTRASTVSDRTGRTSVRVALLAGSTRVRFYTPPTPQHGAWWGPRRSVTIGQDPVIRRILNDTNKYRAAKGKAALRLDPNLMKIAGDWAHTMYRKCDLFHNPSVGSLIPGDWRRWGENVSSGWLYTSAVPEWIGSPSHEHNLVGDFSRIGIGYYMGGNCAQRYYVQNFVKY